MVTEVYERVANRGKYCPIPIAAAVGVTTVVNQIYTYNGVASVATVAKTLTADDLNEWPETANGEAATIAVGTVTTLGEDEPATVTNSGDQNAAIFDFGLPRGERGYQGIQGDPGGEIGVWAIQEVPSGTQDGSNKSFTLAHTPAGVVAVIYNGLEMMNGVDYSYLGTALTLVEFAPSAALGDRFFVRYPH
jgi:hypothetical protein